MLVLDCFCHLFKGYWSRAHCPCRKKHLLQFLLRFSRILEKMSIYVTQFTAWPLVPCVDFLDSLIGNRGICRHFEIHDTGRFSSFSSAIIQKGFLKTEKSRYYYDDIESRGRKGGAVENAWLCSRELLSLPHTCAFAHSGSYVIRGPRVK